MSLFAHYVLLFLSQLVLYSAQNYSQQDICSSFPCGKLGEIGYPFFRNDHPRCGAIAINCTAYDEPKCQFRGQGKWYPIIYINYLSRRFSVHDENLQTHLASNRCDSLKNFSEQAHLDNFTQQKPPSFISFNIIETLPFFKCKHKPNSSAFFHQFDHYNCTDFDLYYKKKKGYLPPLPANSSHGCSVVDLPRARVPEFDTPVMKDNLTLHWGADFTMNWTVLQDCVRCFEEKGECQSTENKSFKCSKKGIDMDEPGKKEVAGVKVGWIIGVLGTVVSIDESYGA